MTYRLSGSITTKLETKGRDRRKFCKEEFKRLMSLEDWTDVFYEQNVDVATYLLETKFLAILEKQAPMKKFQPRTKISDWISVSTKNMMKNRAIARDKAVRSNQEEDWSDYRQLRNNCNKNVKSDRSNNLREHFERHHSKKKTLKVYINLLNKKWDGTMSPHLKCS